MSLTLLFWYDLFLEARAENPEKCLLVFWEIWRHQKDISELTDLCSELLYLPCTTYGTIILNLFDLSKAIIGRASVVRGYEPGKIHIFFHVRIMFVCRILLIYVLYSLFVMWYPPFVCVCHCKWFMAIVLINQLSKF